MHKLTAVFPQKFNARFLLLLILAGVGVVLSQVTWQDYQESRDDVMISDGQIMELTDSVAAHQQRMLDRVSNLLGALGGVYLGQSNSIARCERMLSRQMESFPEYDNIAFVGKDGVVQCSAHPLSNVFFSAIPLLKGAFAKTPLLIPMGSDHLLFAVPHFSSEDKVIGTVVAFLSSYRFFEWAGQRGTGNAALGLIDGNGNIVASYPSFESWKEALHHDPFFLKSLLKMETDAVVRLSDTDGVRGAFMAKPVRGLANSIRLVVSSPVDEAENVFNRNAAVMITVMAMTLLIFGALGILAGSRIAIFLNAVEWKEFFFVPLLKEGFWELQTKAQGLGRKAIAHLQASAGYLRMADMLGNAGRFKDEHVRQVIRLDQLSQGLQGCVSMAELGDMVAQCAQEMYPESRGALLLKAAPDLVETVKTWGSNNHQEAFRPNDCWALRTGRPHQSAQSDGANCSHLKEVTGDYLCIPLIVSGELMGVLHMSHLESGTTNVDDKSDANQLWAAKSIAERVSIAISAVRQHERLRFRATRDVLTGLFNRRFMEEAMEIEQRRALRRNSTIGLMMVDVDHFKQLNDTYGHDSGDSVLRMIGGILRHIIREGDMPCRYGGEEFVVILPGAGLEDTRHRAETLRAAIERSRPGHEGRALGQVTVSIGVAIFPANGSSWQGVLKSADQALYRAKQSGRNRVVSVQ